MRTIARALLPEVIRAAQRQGYSKEFAETGYSRWTSTLLPDACRFAGQKGPPAQCGCDSCRMMMLFNYFDQIAKNFAMVR